jgi:hypothetical protein
MREVVGIPNSKQTPTAIGGRVLVTSGAGYIRRWLVNKLRGMSAIEVVVLNAILPICNNYQNWKGGHQGFRCPRVFVKAFVEKSNGVENG